MSISDLAGKSPPDDLLVNVPRLVTAYYAEHPDPGEPAQRVSFGTSGHRGSAFKRSFNEDHILAVTQAISEYRAAEGIDGPLYLGMDTHALSEPAFVTALEVLAGNGVTTRIDAGRGYTPTPAVSLAIVTANRGRTSGLADGIVITPSHNPPEDGGFKYNPPHGGPADKEVTNRIQDRANEILAGGLEGVRRVPFERALAADTTGDHDYVDQYATELAAVVDVERIRAEGVRIGVDPLGGSAVGYWAPIAERYGLDLDIVSEAVDPTFRFMRVDRDGKIRMDCSSPFAMAGLIDLKDRYDVAFANDTDTDRHGIVTPSRGLLNPNHYLAASIAYLFGHRPDWPKSAGVGKTLVSSSLIDRVAAGMGLRLVEVPVGFKWFVGGLLSADLAFGGEESAGASFLRRDGTVWTTDKDGLILGLLAAEMRAVTGKDPGELYGDLVAEYGEPCYRRVDTPCTAEEKALFAGLTPDRIDLDEFGGEKVEAVLTRAPGNDAPIGGLKVVTKNGWFAARPSGTEDVYKVYAESFLGEEHLDQLHEEARAVVAAAFAAAG